MEAKKLGFTRALLMTSGLRGTDIIEDIVGKVRYQESYRKFGCRSPPARVAAGHSPVFDLAPEFSITLHEALLLPEAGGQGWPQATAQRREAAYRLVRGEAALTGRRRQPAWSGRGESTRR